jgi:hypothetical protein
MLPQEENVPIGWFSREVFTSIDAERFNDSSFTPFAVGGIPKPLDTGQKVVVVFR